MKMNFDSIEFNEKKLQESFEKIRSKMLYDCLLGILKQFTDIIYSDISDFEKLKFIKKACRKILKTTNSKFYDNLFYIDCESLKFIERRDYNE